MNIEPKMQPHQFRTTDGKVWTLRINVNNYATIRDSYNIDITDMSADGSTWMSKLSNDMVALLGILAELTDKERESRNMTLEQFFDVCGGDTLIDATDAILDAAVSFLPAHHRLAFTKILQKMKAGQKMVGEKMEAEVDLLFTEESLEKSLDKTISSARERYTS